MDTEFLTAFSSHIRCSTGVVPAVRDLIGMLEAAGCIIVSDAMHCQKETAALIVEKQADYLLNVKDNQPALKNDLEEHVQDGDLRKNMDTFTTREKNGGRIEIRRGFVTHDIEWLYGKDEWKNLRGCLVSGK